MENTKTFVFPDNGGFGGNSTEGLLLGSMMNGGGFGGNGMWNNPIWAIVFLAALRNGGIFGNDGNAHGCTTSQLSAIQETLNSNHGQTLLMDAIKGNGNSIHELATTLNCNQNAVIGAINSVQGAICNLGNSVGMNSMQIVNAINAGNASLANQLNQCCCDVRQDVTKMGYENQINNLQQSQMIQNGFAQIGYATAEQTCAIKQAIDANGDRVIAKLDEQDKARMQREINALTAENASIKARAERAAEKADTDRRIDAMACKMPQTVTLPYSCATAVPTNALYNAALFGGAGVFGLNNGGIFG